MTVITIGIYNVNAWDILPHSSGGSFTYTGPATATGSATITDTGGPGSSDLTLEDGGSAGETATADVTIGGNTSIGTGVNNDCVWTFRDTVTGDTFEVIQFDVHSGAASGLYMASEMPLVAGRVYDVLALDGSPNEELGSPVFTYADYVCFTPGTFITTPTGYTPVEELREGDLVETKDNGTQELLWIGRRHVTFEPGADRHKPIELKAGCMGNRLPRQTLSLSPQHKVIHLVPKDTPTGSFDEVLSIAKSLATFPGVRQKIGCRQVTYYSLMTSQHDILFANGLAVESFYPGKYALSLLSWIDRLRIVSRFPGVQTNPEQAFGPLVRPSLKPGDTRRLPAPIGIGMQKKPFSLMQAVN